MTMWFGALPGFPGMGGMGILREVCLHVGAAFAAHGDLDGKQVPGPARREGDLLHAFLFRANGADQEVALETTPVQGFTPTSNQ